MRSATRRVQMRARPQRRDPPASDMSVVLRSVIPVRCGCRGSVHPSARRPRDVFRQSKSQSGTGAATLSEPFGDAPTGVKSLIKKHVRAGITFQDVIGRHDGVERNGETAPEISPARPLLQQTHHRNSSSPGYIYNGVHETTVAAARLLVSC